MTPDVNPPHTPDEADVERRLAALSLEEKIGLLTGRGPWRLHPAEGVGLRSLALGDGPAGIRGVTDDPAETGASFPSPSALSATWDVRLADELGDLFAAEAVRHGVDVVLAPVVNLQRTPVGGRHFECFSEDPLLTADIAHALVAAIQRNGVAACAKHFVANDSETARTEYTARIDERALREVYLAPFEKLVRDTGVWTVMAAYNGLETDAETASATQNHWLLTELLKTEWGFDGVVVSDWTAAHSTAESANAGLDLVMPGPGGPWEAALLKAVNRGEVAEKVIDAKVRRLLRLAHRVGGFGPVRDGGPAAHTEDLLRRIGARSTVVLKDAARRLPCAPASLSRVALIGPNAVDTFFQGGGSAHVNPDHVVTPEAGLRAALPHAEISVHRGGYARPHEPDLAVERVVGEVSIDLLDGHGGVIDTVPMPAGGWLRDLGPAPVAARLRAVVRLPETGVHRLGIGTVGTFRLRFDGREVASGDHLAGHDVVLDSSVNAPPSHGADVHVTEPRELTVEADLQIIEAWGYGRFVRAVLRHRLPGPGVDDEIAEAVAAAARADLAIVVVGTNSEVESEGFDRTDLALPGRQDELVRQVCRANPATVVVVNAGSPVLLPWLDEAATVLWTWFPGQECGHSLADVLFGRTEPSGRLPWTLPATAEQVPVPHAVPVDGVVEYHEGIHIGYRGYLRAGLRPAVPFGHGLGWTDWSYDEAEVADGDEVTVTVSVTNSGRRPGHETVQVYLEHHGDGPERPVRWLAGFAVVDAAPGESARAVVTVPRRAFQVWDPPSRDWRTPPGEYTLHVGRSIEDIRWAGRITREDVSSPAGG
ncbi:beta-glucosidase [Stackebrandtia albiflava]|uniref:Beta-glucosidase n=1 Tax=Stackebrandtia albiflava TaxID=406432 RepID=A0A562VE40_9ACTN|nr:glycoside hydrolase family 3 C-terminal domain-containing protein [Stackebrandtia albiflava]TWJ16156.1 beta-glucosidase [Stackebrandtia albiflava]